MNAVESLASATVLVVTTNADLAGAPLHVRSLVTGLAQRTGRMAVAFGEDGPVRRELATAGLETFVIPTMRSNFNFAQDILSIIALSKIVAGLRPSFLHAHSTKAGMIARIVGALFRVPVIYTVHGWGFGPARRRHVSAIVSVIERALRRFTAHYITVSDVDRALGRAVLQIEESRLTTVHNGVDSTSYLSDPDAKDIIVMVARASYPKDYATLFRAAEGLNCHIRCVGSGTDTPAFKAMAKQLAPTAYERFEFLGARSDIPAILGDSSICVLSSRFEGLPLSVIEAMRAGLPVIASDVGGMRELVENGRTGFLFPPTDSEALRAHLSTLLARPELRATLGRHGRTVYSQRFTVERMLEKTEEIYTTLITPSKKNEK